MCSHSFRSVDVVSFPLPEIGCNCFAPTLLLAMQSANVTIWVTGCKPKHGNDCKRANGRRKKKRIFMKWNRDTHTPHRLSYFVVALCITHENGNKIYRQDESTPTIIMNSIGCFKCILHFYAFIWSDVDMALFFAMNFPSCDSISIRRFNICCEANTGIATFITLYNCWFRTEGKWRHEWRCVHFAHFQSKNFHWKSFAVRNSTRMEFNPL